MTFLWLFDDGKSGLHFRERYVCSDKTIQQCMSRHWLGENHHIVLQSVAATKSSMSQCQKVVATMLMAVLGGRENSELHRRKVGTTSYWVKGRNCSLHMPDQTFIVLFPGCSQFRAAIQCSAAYVRLWQQELIALSVVSASCIAVCVLWWLSGLHVSKWGEGC